MRAEGRRDGDSMNFLKLYARVLGRLGPEKWLAALLVLANVAIAVSLFAEPMLFGRIIDQLTRSLQPGQRADMGGHRAMARRLGGVRHLHHRRRRHGRPLFRPPLPSPAGGRDGRLFRSRAAPADEFSRQRPHRAAAQDHDRGRLAACSACGCRSSASISQPSSRSVVLLPATLIVNWRLGGILLVLVVALGVPDEHRAAQDRGRCRAPPTSIRTTSPNGCRTCSATCRRSRASPAPTRRRARSTA